jgi:hypothetical protein
MVTVDDFDRGTPQRNFFREFTVWAPWSARDQVPDGHGYRIAEYSGVYLFAHFEKTPVGSANILDEAIFYVGEALWLADRWRQFERSARHGKSGHSGGHSYRDKFGTTRWSQLHVAALPIWFGDAKQPRSAEDWTQAYRLCVERRVIWELTVARNGTHRLLNRK